MVINHEMKGKGVKWQASLVCGLPIDSCLQPDFKFKITPIGMLKHVSSTLTRRRGVSPAPSSASISTLESSGSSASSTCSSPSTSSNSCHHSSTSGHNSSSSLRSLADCRTFSRLSVTENPNAVSPPSLFQINFQFAFLDKENKKQLRGSHRQGFTSIASYTLV